MSDLISRKTAIEAFTGKPPEYYHTSYIVGELNCLPSVDAAPVVHARWIETKIPANTTGHGGVGQDKKNGWLCSNCRCAFDAKLLWCQNYCPNCGAKMDGERRDES